MSKHAVTFNFNDGVTRQLSVTEGETVLDAAERQGLYLSNDCREGSCGVCTCQSERGEFESGSTIALSAREIEENKKLPCQLKVKSDGVLNFDYPSTLCKPTLRHNFTVTVTAVKMISEAAAQLTVHAQDLSQTVQFKSGQFVSMLVPGSEEWRPYSMANVVNKGNVLEFIIRILPDGVMSNYLRKRAAVGDQLLLTPPRGSFMLRTISRPLLFVAGGTGLSAIISMLREIAEGSNADQNIQLLYGVNTPADICMADELEVLASKLRNFSYDIVSVKGSDEWKGKTGFVSDHINSDFIDNGDVDVDVYLCGPPPMIESVSRWFDESLCEGYRLYSELFAPAPVKKSRLTNVKKGLKPYQRAVVVGGSISGMTSAKVLSEYFDEVIILERDSGHSMEQPRDVTPQAHHAHHLLQRGQREFETVFPDFLCDLRAAGAQVYDASKDYRTYQNGSWKVVTDSGVDMYAMRRCVFETVMRQQIDKVDNIDYHYDAKVKSLIMDDSNSRVEGVHYETALGNKILSADLVVDSSGKNAQLYNGLLDNGFKEPNESEMALEIYYMTCLFHVRPEDVPDWSMMTIYNHRPYEKEIGYAAFYSDDKSTLLVTLGAYGCERPARSFDEFVRRAKELQQPHIYELIKKCERSSELQVFKYPRMFRRHYEQLKSVPDGFIAMGDAFATADPISGAGMTKAVLEAKELSKLLSRRRATLVDLPKRYYREAAKIFDYMWLVIGEQALRYPWVDGKRPYYQKPINIYVDHVLKASAYDRDVFVKYLMVVHFNAKVGSLFSPKIFLKVLKSMLMHGVKVKYQKPESGEVRVPLFT